MPFLASNINKEKYSCFWVTEILNKTRKLISDYKVTFWSILLSSFDFHEKKFLWSDLLHNYQIFCKISLKFVKEIWSHCIYIKLGIFWMFTVLPMFFEHVQIVLSLRFRIQNSGFTIQDSKFKIKKEKYENTFQKKYQIWENQSICPHSSITKLLFVEKFALSIAGVFHENSLSVSYVAFCTLKKSVLVTHWIYVLGSHNCNHQ